MIVSQALSPLSQRLQLPNQRKIFAIYELTLLMYTVASPPGGRGQLPNPDPNPGRKGQLPMARYRGQN